MTNNNTTTITPSDETTENQITRISPKKIFPAARLRKILPTSRPETNNFLKDGINH